MPILDSTRWPDSVDPREVMDCLGWDFVRFVERKCPEKLIEHVYRTMKRAVNFAINHRSMDFPFMDVRLWIRKDRRTKIFYWRVVNGIPKLVSERFSRTESWETRTRAEVIAIGLGSVYKTCEPKGVWAWLTSRIQHEMDSVLVGTK